VTIGEWTNSSHPLRPYNRNVAAQQLKHGTKYEQLGALVFQVIDADATLSMTTRGG
jgi:hypothetical protein